MILDKITKPADDMVVILYREHPTIATRWIVVVVSWERRLKVDVDTFNEYLKTTGWKVVTQSIAKLRRMAADGVWIVHGLREDGS